MPKIFTLLLLTSAIAAGSGPASAAPIAPYDSTYGTDGTLRLRSNATFVNQVVQSCEIVSGGAMAIAGRFGYEEKSYRLATALVPDFRTPRSRTSGASWHSQQVPPDEKAAGLDFATNGSLAYATVARRNRSIKYVRVFRTLRSGRPDRRFGGDGQIVHRLGTPVRTLAPGVLVLRDGGVVLSVSESGERRLIRFASSGRVVRNWASAGVFQASTVAPGTVTPALQSEVAIETADRGLLVAAGNAAEPPASRRTGLLKLTRSGVIDTTFGDGGLWLPPAPFSERQGTPYSRPGQTMMAELDNTGRIAVLFTDLASHDTGTSYDYRLATVGANGQTVFSTPVVGDYFDGGDDGFPDSHPMGLLGTAAGIVFATGETYYGPNAGTFRGFATRWREGAASADTYKPIGTQSPFAADDFASSADGRHVYACGSIGRTSSKTKPPWQRKRVAIRRIKL